LANCLQRGPCTSAPSRRTSSFEACPNHRDHGRVKQKTESRVVALKQCVCFISTTFGNLQILNMYPFPSFPTNQLKSFRVRTRLQKTTLAWGPTAAKHGAKSLNVPVSLRNGAVLWIRGERGTQRGTSLVLDAMSEILHGKEGRALAERYLKIRSYYLTNCDLKLHCSDRMPELSAGRYE